MSEVDDRDFALAEKSLAGLRDDGRADAAAHPGNCGISLGICQILLLFLPNLPAALLEITDRSRLSLSLSSSLLPRRKQGKKSDTLRADYSVTRCRRS